MLDWTLESCYRQLLIPAQNVLNEVERFGVIYDVDRAEHLRDTEIMPKLEQYAKTCDEVVGQPINLNSTKQVPAYLYDMAGVRDPRVNKQKRLRSVDKDTREHLLATAKNLAPAVRAFLENMHEFKTLDKLRGTYIDGLIKRVGPDGRLHCEFPIFGTETGRLSSRHPNLQNQPRGSFIRQLYVAPKNRCILSADYSQAEYRTAAHLSGDANLIRVYAEERDLHGESARKLYGDGYTKADRDKAKRVNFGILYEQGAYSLSLQIRMPQKECQALIDTFWQLYPTCREWLTSVQDGAVQQGFVQTPFGRVRRFPLITSDIIKEIQRQAGNTVIQSTASDFNLWALVNVYKTLDLTRCHPVITVHDSIICECDLDYKMEAAAILRSCMEAAAVETLGWDDIVITSEVSAGPDWGHLEDIAA